MDPFPQRLLDFLDEIGFPHSELRFRGGSNDQVFLLHHGVEGSKYRFYYELSGFITEHILMLWTFPLLQIPETRLPAVAEYALRANRSMWFGSFDMEYENGGRIGFRTSLMCDGAEPGFAVLRDWLDWNLGTLAIHMPYIQQVVYEDVSATDAFQAMEAEK